MSSAQGNTDDQEGVVEFIAQFETDDQIGTLHETSNFRREKGLWVYVDGDVELRT